EHGVEHDRGGRRVEQEVVVLDDATQVARRDGATQLGGGTVSGWGHRGGLSAVRAPGSARQNLCTARRAPTGSVDRPARAECTTHGETFVAPHPEAPPVNGRHPRDPGTTASS